MTPLAKKVFELFGKSKPVVEVADKRAVETVSPSWSCPQCGGPVVLETITDHLPTRFWHCQTCRTQGATREGASHPVVWVSSGVVQ
jgi:predicted RNA-binding Zn-ribbon protein involved in translation (DUF1610 family)